MKRPGSRDAACVFARAVSRVCRAAWLGRTARTTLAAIAVGATLATNPLSVRAAEPFEEFLVGLDSRGMYEQIAWYLDEQSNNPDLDPALKATIPYQQGFYLLEWAKNIKDTKLRFEKLDLAAAKLDAFVKASPNDERAPLANMNLGNVLVERAKAKIYESERPNQAANKDKLLAEAREYFKQASKAIDDAIAKMDDKLKTFPKGIDSSKEPAAFKAREAAREQYLVGKDAWAKVEYERSKTFPEKSKERIEVLRSAVERFKANAERFHNRGLGVLSKLRQAGCLVEIDGPEPRKQALALIDTLTAGEEQDAVMRAFQAEATQLAVQILSHPEEKKADRAAERGDKFLGQARGAEDREEEWQGIRWYTLLAKKQMLAGADDGGKKKLTREIVAMAQTVAKSPNAHRDEARKLLADPAFGGAALGSPTDFAGAWDAATAEYGAMLQFLEELKTAKDDAAAKEIEKKIKASQDKAADYSRLAIALKGRGDEKPSIDAIVKAHYLICTVYLMQGDYHRTAVMADYITSNFPDSADARPAATCALKAYSQLFARAQGDRSYEAGQLEGAAKMMLTKWPNEEAADEARLAMLSIHLDRGEYDKLPELLKQVPETSPSRADMELRVGAADWRHYLQLSRLPEESRPSQAELDKIAKEAETLLVAGVNRASKNQEAGDVSQTYLRGQANLAQLYSRSAKHKEALAVLEAKPNGVLTLLEGGNATAKSMPGLDTNVYAVALQSYVTTKNQPRAEAMMKSLETAAAASGPQAQQMLMGIYVRLGKELEEDLKRLATERKVDEYRSTLDSAKVFLKKIAEKGNELNFATTNWVAGTFYSLGRAASDEGSTADAQTLFAEASTTYGMMLKKSADWWPVAAEAKPEEQAKKVAVYRNAVRIRQAECLRETKKYDEAVKALEAILKESPNNLDAQKAIAETYQVWGVDKKDVGKLNIAMAGENEKGGKKKLVWGWNYMARSMQKHALDVVPNPDDPSQTEPTPFAQTFFEARLNLSRGLFQASTVDSANNKKKHLASAAKGIVFVAQQYPRLGGPETYGQFDALLKKIQTAQGEKPIGLADITKATIVAEAEAAATDGTGVAATAGPKSTGPKAKKEEKVEPTNPVVYIAGVGVLLFAGGLYFLMNMQKKGPAPAKKPAAPAAGASKPASTK